MIGRERLEILCRRSVTMLTSQTQNRRRLIIILSLVILLMVMLSLMMFHKAEAEIPIVNDSTETYDYRSALAENLQKLREMNKHIYHAKPNVAQLRKNNFKQAGSKAYRIRQNAPTRVYLSKSDDLNGAPSPGHSTLLDKSSYSHFANQATRVSSVSAHRVSHPESTIIQGEFIHAILETAIDSDLPGMIRAVIARPVYSYQGDHLLIPEGSRLIGQYSSQTLQGINRVMVIWQRIVLPNGVSVQIDSPGSDALGEAGFTADQVNRHFLTRFGQASLMSLIGAVVSNTNPAAQYETAIAQSFQSSANQTLDKSIAIKPTIQIHQGAKVIVFVARDLDFYAARGEAKDE